MNQYLSYQSSIVSILNTTGRKPSLQVLIDICLPFIHVSQKPSAPAERAKNIMLYRFPCLIAKALWFLPHGNKSLTNFKFYALTKVFYAIFFNQVFIKIFFYNCNFNFFHFYTPYLINIDVSITCNNLII